MTIFKVGSWAWIRWSSEKSNQYNIGQRQGHYEICSHQWNHHSANYSDHDFHVNTKQTSLYWSINCWFINFFSKICVQGVERAYLYRSSIIVSFAWDTSREETPTIDKCSTSFAWSSSTTPVNQIARAFFEQWVKA